jgi:hypothetical protein
MSKKNTYGAETQSDTPVEDTPVVEAQTDPGPIPGTVRIINMRPEPRDITLITGRTLLLGPFSREGNRHISEPVPKKNLHRSSIDKMIARKEIKLKEEVA